MRIKKRNMLFLMGICLIIVIISILNKQDIDLILNELKKSYIVGTDLDENLKNKISIELEDNKLDKTEKYFILGYLSLEEKDKESAKKYFELSIKNQQKNTDKIIKIYSYKFLADIMIEEQDFKKAIKYTNSAFLNINKFNYNKDYEMVWDIFKNISGEKEGRKLVIEKINSVLETKYLDIETQLFLYKKMCVLYTLNTDYASAIATNIKIIKLSSKINDKYYIQKSIVDMSYIARELSGYHTAIEILNSVDSTNIIDETKRIDLEIYKLLNLSQCEILEGQYDKALQHLYSISVYKEYIPSPKKEAIECLTNITTSEAYVNKNEIVKAKYYIDLAKNNLLQSEKVYSDTNIYYNLVLGKIYIAEEKFNEAIYPLRKSEEFLKNQPTIEYYSRVKKELILAHKELGNSIDATSELKEILKFEEEQHELISQQYYEYVSYKERYEQIERHKEYAKIITLSLFLFIITLVSIIIKIILYPYFSNRCSRKKIKSYLENNNYILNYQPIVNPKEENIVGFEALIRLKVNEKLIMPNIIIKEIEEYNMMGEVSIWILKKIIKDYFEISKINGLVSDFYVSMNISLKEIENEKICKQLIQILKESNINKDSICLEITENVPGNDYNKIKSNVSELIKCGFKIAIDDFGVDYSNLSFLEMFDFNIIKLDKYFIDNIEKSIVVQSLIDAVNYLSSKKNITVVMEGIEDLNQVNRVKKISSDKFYIQGYYYSKPVEIEKLKNIKITH